MFQISTIPLECQNTVAMTLRADATTRNFVGDGVK